MRKRGFCRSAVGAVVLAAGTLVTGAAHAQVAETFGLADHRIAAPEKIESRPWSERLGLDLDAERDFVGQVMLPPVDVDRLRQEDAERDPWDKVLRWGVGRDIQVHMTDGRWHDLPGIGRLWVVDVIAAEALAMRVQFSDMNLPEGATLHAYSVADNRKVAGPYGGTGLFENGEFWGPTLYGDQTRIELFVPQQADMQFAAGNEFFRIGRIQHMYRDPVQEAFQDGEDRGAGPCHNDASCYPAWADVVSASAGVGWVGTNSLWCSGTMLNCTANDQTPYWLTANHCLSSAGDANSAEIYWLYQRNGCGGSIPSVASVPQSAVCQVMGTGSASDYTLLMIRGEIPTGLFWAGWYSGTVSNGTNTTCVHHPDGDYKRISFGTKSSNSTNYVRINWYDGPTEPGSSGSGIFRDSTQQLYGQLCCGISACGSETWDDYGYFFRTYPNISSFLAGGSDDNQEQNDSCASAVTVSSSTYNNLVVKSVDEDWYRVNIPFGNTLDLDLTFIDAYGDIDVELYDGCGGSVVGSATSGTNNETLSYTNIGPAADFFVRVFLASDTRAEYSMTVDVVGGGGAGNDNCANATPITDGMYTFSNVGATTDGPSEMRCDGAGSATITGDIWYLYEATCSADVVIDLCGSSFDTRVAVYASLACPTGPNGALACNDDFDCNGNGDVADDGYVSRVAFSVTAGFDYLIRVGGYNGDEGVGQMTVTCFTGPLNDNCADAIAIGDGLHAFDNIDATTDGPDEPSLCSNSGDTQVQSDIWYRYTASCDGTLTVSTCGTPYDSKIAIYDGSCPSSPDSAIGCNDDFDCNDNGDVADDGYVAQATATVVSGNDYLVRIGGYEGAQGAGAMVVFCTPGVPMNCPGDANGDDMVDFDDLNVVLGQWGTIGPEGDVDDDGDVDFDDLNLVLGNWGTTCP